ncbi:MAG: hypothetical protein V4773_16055 [Verrucomicrobiota bacterium]
MKNFLSVLSLILAVATAAIAADSKKAAPAADAADNYPLKTCVVSDEPLGSMGEFISFTHKEAGKPDRVVRFCCEGCIEDFKADPAKFLKKIDAAAAKQKAAPAKK